MNITILALLYPKTLNDGAITLYNIENYVTNSVKKKQRWSPRGHILKSLALASSLESSTPPLEKRNTEKLCH